MFVETAEKLNEVYEFLKANKGSISETLTNEEYKAYVEVVDLCEAIYDITAWGMDE
jgi:hypothetical protein